jgi:hypothetical protein
MNDVMNGAEPHPQKLVITNPVVDILERVLADAKAGKISSIAFVGILVGGGAAPGYAGVQLSDLYLAVDAVLKPGIAGALLQPQSGPRIIRATPRG